MRVLFDQGTPAPLRRMLAQHEVETSHERGWSQLTNGELLDAAEREGFAVVVTTDTNLKYQQNLESRRLAVVVLATTNWPRIQRMVGAVGRWCDGRQLCRSRDSLKTARVCAASSRLKGVISALEVGTQASKPESF